MTVRVYKKDKDMTILSEVQERHNNGNTFSIYKSGLFGPLSLHIENDELSIFITHTSADNLLSKLLYSRHLRMEILKDLYSDDRCKTIWNNWEEQSNKTAKELRL